MTVRAAPPPGGSTIPVEGLSLSLGDRVGRIRDRVRALEGWRAKATAFGAGALSVLAMAPFFLWPVLFITLPVLVWLLDGIGERTSTPGVRWWRRYPTLQAAAAIGWWWGFGYFLLGTFWIGEAFLVEAEIFAWLLPFAVTLLPAGLALFPAAALAAARAAWPPGFSRVLILAIALSLAEWLRGHVLTGFPWNVLGYALTSPLPLMQAAGLLGIYGLTLCAVVILTGPLVAFADRREGRATWTGAIISAVLLAGLSAYGAAKLAAGAPGDVPGVKLRIVQPSVPQRDKWRREKQREIFDDHLDLSRRNPVGEIDNLIGVTHLVWPEAAMPFLPLASPEALQAIGELLGQKSQLITGALRVEQVEGTPQGSRPARRIFNSLMVFGQGGQLTAIYDKIHLVPFGEYLPMQPLLEAIGLEQLTRIRGGFDIGVTPRPLLNVSGLPPLLGLVCYEAIFPTAVVQGRDRPGVIVNVTNDGWFGNSTGPRQHLHQTRVRAVEEGIPIIRAANNGISAVIDGQGRVRQWLGMNVHGVIDSSLPEAVAPPLYARFGDWMFLAALAVAVTAAAGSRV